jgi:hypothetical protein
MLCTPARWDPLRAEMLGSNDRVHRPPARGRRARLEAQPDDIFERDLAPLFRVSVAFTATRSVPSMLVLSSSRRCTADPKSLHQKRADLRLFVGTAGDGHDIRRFDFSGFEQLAIDQSDQRRSTRLTPATRMAWPHGRALIHRHETGPAAAGSRLDSRFLLCS